VDVCVFFVLEQQGKEMMAGGVCERVAAISLIAVLLQLAGLTLFVLGFFPVKPALMGISGIESVKPVCNYEEEATHKGASYQEVSGITPQYDRLIIMVSFLCLTFHL
jgi:ethanolaminephosphotransferase